MEGAVMTSNPGIVPVMDVNNCNHGYDGYGMGGGAWFLWIIVLFALLGGNGWNRNNNNGYDVAAGIANGSFTRDHVSNEFDFSDMKNGIRSVQNGLCDGFYNMNTTMLSGFNGVQRDLCQGFASVNSGLAENRFTQQQCCCEINRNIDAVRAENYRNTCDITNAIHAEGEATRALINHNTMQDLRDKLADRDRDLMSANFQLSQLSQTSNIVNSLRPFPQPAYITCSPYQAVNGYGYNCGGCCNTGCCNG